MKRFFYFAIILFIASSCTDNSSTTNQSDCVDTLSKGNEQMESVEEPEPQTITENDSLMNIIYEQLAKGNVVFKYSDVSKNSKQYVRSGHGYVKVPDSIAYQKAFYKDGTICCEGYVTFFESIELDGDEVGKWKYRTPDGTEFERNYSMSIGID